MTTPLRAIRTKCLDCCCGQVNEVRLCPCLDCSLYPYRLGKDPARAGKGNISNLQRKASARVDNSDNQRTTLGNHTSNTKTKKARCTQTHEHK